MKKKRSLITSHHDRTTHNHSSDREMVIDVLCSLLFLLFGPGVVESKNEYQFRPTAAEIHGRFGEDSSGDSIVHSATKLRQQSHNIPFHHRIIFFGKI